MPALSLGIVSLRAAAADHAHRMLEVLSSDYIRTACAKGATRGVVIVAATRSRNALIPYLTVGAVEFGFLFGGVVIIEDIFLLPGIGSLVLVGIINRDYPVLLGRRAGGHRRGADRQHARRPRWPACSIRGRSGEGGAMSAPAATRAARAARRLPALRPAGDRRRAGRRLRRRGALRRRRWRRYSTLRSRRRRHAAGPVAPTHWLGTDELGRDMLSRDHLRGAASRSRWRWSRSASASSAAP